MNYSDFNDYELIYMISDNNENAFDILMNKYGRLVEIEASKFKYAAQKCGLEYQDIVQEGNIGLLAAINKYSEKQGACFYTFAVVFIRRYIMASIRYNNKVSNIVLNSAISLDDETEIEKPLLDLFAVDNSTPLNHLEYKEFIKSLINFKNSLSDLDSMIFELRMNEFTYNEIAQLLDITRKKVDNRCSFIRNKYKMSKNMYF